MTGREKKLAIIALIVVIFYFFFQYLIYPKWAEIVNLRQAAQKAKFDLMLSQSKTELLEKLEKGESYLINKKTIGRKEKSLSVFRGLFKAASQAQLSLVYLKPVPNEDEKLTYSLSLIGSYSSFKSFLDILSKMEMALMIDSIDINGNLKAKDLKIEILLSAYY